ncbi:MAG: patatin-like phospholipase family protein [Alsobacter sp.]
MAKAPAPSVPPSARKRVNLALQGGGAHGAFTWGVLDALLEDGRLDVEAISGTSAGAMNATVLACGLGSGGPETARANLEGFWRDVSLDGNMSPGQRMLFDGWMNAWSLNGTTHWASFAEKILSPYDLNPLDLNPLRDVVAKHVNFAHVRACTSLELFIAATNVRTGKVRVFRRDELDADMLMASAALPTLFKAVQIEGEAYWDGGYMGNPVLFPFFTETQTEDIVLVQINPIVRREIPESSRAIVERMNEITFNASLLHELRAIDFVRRLKDMGRLEGLPYKRVRLHRIEAQKELASFGAESKLNPDWEFFLELKEIGRKAARRFLRTHYDDVGVEGTVDLRHEIS